MTGREPVLEPTARLAVRVVEEHSWACVGATVLVDLGDQALEQLTDPAGQALFILPLPPRTCEISVDMEGFIPSTYVHELKLGPNIVLFRLKTAGGPRANLSS
jgi:hypothetical protein